MLLRLTNSREFVALFHAVLRLGAVVVPVSPDLRAPQLDHIVRDCTPTLAVVESDDAEWGSTSVPSMDVAAAVADAAGTQVDETLTEVSPHDVALLVYTSGSTAAPKGVVCPHDRVVFAAKAIGERLGYRPTDVVYGRMPFSFDYGLYQILLAALTGASLALPRKPTDLEALQQIRDHGVTVVPLVPTLATTLHLLVTRDPRPTSVRRFTNTGAELTVEHTRRLRAAFPGADIISMYGMTECKRITISEPDDDLLRPGTVGKPLKGTEVSIVDESGAEVRPGAVGEILVRGSHVMAGYWNASVETVERFRRDPVTGAVQLHTGDYGWLDDDGDLHLVGRRDDIFKRRGVRVSTTEIEAAALAVGGVLEAAAVADVPDAGLVLWYTGDLAEAALRITLATRLDPARVPDRCVPLRDMPRTAHGKVDRKLLVENTARSGGHDV
ncbi:acyl-CoA synthetase (AMP-forming)/AMP-acid ligase II [Saccharothrix ecbatanensis]|uniref:Acyl-CoA synthetase (AMP-forming)/AMP-acid ligase II n=1 Tax=Saccharothrix ecbatanensis TaxID=1105145 RepID=A0A7W9LXZ9_9PSEU|nr:acyl-CoA synthetase (AMP-forming)/AMP-acid ligase II [Saccharothrix ecbatanensis]